MKLMDPRNGLPLSEIKGRLEELLGQVPSVRLKGWQNDVRSGNGTVDLVLNLAAGSARWRIFIEAKSSGEPRLIRTATTQLRAVLFGEQLAYPVVAAPYIGERSARICHEAGVGYVDLAGNCRLAFGEVFVEYRNFPNPRLERRSLRSIFTPKASRVLRVLLSDAKRSWQVKTLAQEASVSLGLAFKVKQRLLDLEYGDDRDKALRLTRPEDLLQKWAANYSYRKNDAIDCFGQADPPELEAQLADYCRSQKIQYALTLFSAAARVAPFTKYARGFSYAVADPGKVAEEIGWQPVGSGANFTILSPYDEGILYGTREVGGKTVVSDVQLYLDLAGYKGRGEEAAEFLLEQRLRPQW